MFSALAHSLKFNYLCSNGDMSGLLKLAEALPRSQLTSLRWPTSPLNFAWTLCLCLPLRQQPLTRCASPMRSVHGNTLPIDELKGTKPVESIDLSKKGLGVAECIIIAACIKENAVLKELKCAARPLHMHSSVNSP